MQTNIIEVKGVSKRFGHNRVLEEVNFSMPPGVIYGISSYNGSGKSVFLRILSGLVIPDAGTTKVFGKRVGIDLEFAPDTGILIDNAGFLTNLSGRQNLELLAKVSGRVSSEKIREVLAVVGLNPADTRPVRTYSTGMRQRLGLAQAVMEEPSLLILDEPTNGLDYEGQRDIYTYLAGLRADGKTILLTSHSLDELKILCDKVFTIKNRQVIPFELAGIGEDLAAGFAIPIVRK